MSLSDAELQELALLREMDRRGMLASQGSPTDQTQEQVDRKGRSSESILEFGRAYFPHYLSRGCSPLHEYLAELFYDVVTDPRPRRAVIAAPRGNAKTTWLSKICVLWCICYPDVADKHYILLLSDTSRQAKTNLLAVRQELESNQQLRQDFGDLTSKEKWTEEEILTSNGIRIGAYGSGSKGLRGATSGPHRPDLVLPDDMENQENVVTPYQRDKSEEWLTDTVMKTAGPKGLDLIMAGTVLHQDSVLARFLANPAYESKIFRAVESWPIREDLWEDWRTIFTDLSLQERERKSQAREFYKANRSEMDRGVKVLWPEGEDIYSLYETLVTDGPASFFKEKNNDPKDPESCKFREDWFRFWWLSEEQGEPGGYRLPQITRYIGSCDPSMGKNKKANDYSAIVVIGVGTDNRGYILEADLQRRHPDKIIDDIIDMQLQYRCVEWAFESIAFQEFIRTELVKRALERGVQVPAIPVQSQGNKELRIESLQPAVRNGFLIFRASHRLLLNQMKYYTGSGKDHDDGPDALEMAYSRIQGQAVASTAPDVGYRQQPTTRSGVDSTSSRGGISRAQGREFSSTPKRNPFRRR